MPEGVNFVQKENQIFVTPSTIKRYSRERHGLCRTLISNMVQGVTDGYSKKLEIVVL
jgi:large subunit ribosomal protein L6